MSKGYNMTVLLKVNIAVMIHCENTAWRRKSFFMTKTPFYCSSLMNRNPGGRS